MPILPQQQTIVQYVTNVSQLNYTFAFYAPLATDIQVFYQAANATPIPSSQQLTLNVDYSVTFNADQTTGGFITLLFTPTTGYYLTINRQVAASLATNFADAQTFNGANLDAALDRLLLLCQQNLNYALERNLSYVINTYLPNAVPFTQLPPLPLNYFWVGSGSGVVAAQISTIPSASVLQSLLASNAPGTDGGLLVGFYDYYAANATNVSTLLNYRNVPATDSGTFNALAVTVAPTYTSYHIGSSLNVVAGNTNTGATTLNVNSIGAKNVVKQTPAGFIALQGGEIVAGNVYQFFYDGTEFQLLNPSTELAMITSIYRSTSQTLTHGIDNLISWNTLDFADPYGVCQWTGGDAIVATKKGMYRVTADLNLTGFAGNAGDAIMNLYHNVGAGNVLYDRLAQNYSGQSDIIVNGSLVLPCNAGDILSIWCTPDTTNNITLTGTTVGNFFQVEYLGN